MSSKEYLRKYRVANRERINDRCRAYMRRIRRWKTEPSPCTNRLVSLRAKHRAYRIWSTRVFDMRSMLHRRVYHFELKAEPGNSTTAQSYEHLVTLLNFSDGYQAVKQG